MSRWLRLRGRFWFLPTVLCLAAAVLAEALIALDRRVDDLDLGPLGFLVSEVGVAGSRDLLGAIAGSMLTVAATTFSITIAVLALSSSTYGPRLVRNFMTDRGNQFVLGVYVATFLYSLLVLRSVRAVDDGGGASFVPHLAVTVGVLLAVVSIGVLVYFIHHISDSVQVWTLARRVRTELVATVDRLYPEHMGHDARDLEQAQEVEEPLDVLGAERATVRSDRTGYVQGLHEKRLVEIACSHDLVVSLLVRPGTHVNEGAPLAEVCPPDRATDDVRAQLNDVFLVGRARSPFQDVEFSVMQLEEMAVRALSPSFNDPYTAINAMDDLSAGLVLLAGRRTPSSARYDDEGRLRVLAQRVDLVDLLDRVLDAMRIYAIEHPSVLHRTLGLVQQVGAASEHRDTHRRLTDHVQWLLQAYDARSPQPCDRQRLQEHGRQVLGSLHGPVVG